MTANNPREPACPSMSVPHLERPSIITPASISLGQMQLVIGDPIAAENGRESVCHFPDRKSTFESPTNSTRNGMQVDFKTARKIDCGGDWRARCATRTLV
jgi:hypothetical protein